MRARLLGFALAAVALAAAPAFGGAERWVEVKSPDFVVVSNASEKEAREIDIQFEQIRSLFRQALPIAQNHNGPVVTILAAKNEKTLQDLLPEYWTKGHAHPAGIFEQALNQFYIALEMDAPGPNPYVTIYHEYYHSLTTPYEPNMPTWLAEGLADFFGNSEIDGKTAMIGEPSEPLLYQLQGQPFIPLDTLFHVTQTSPYYNEDSKATIFYAESWALIHYFILGDGQTHKPMLTAYLKELGEGATEDKAVTAFGNLGELQAALQEYIRRGSYSYFRLAAPPRIDESELRARQLSEADVDAYKGGFAATRGFPEAAKTELAQAIQLDPKNALAQSNLAIAQFFSGQKSEALDSASTAVALDPNNSVTRYLRAYLAYNELPGARNPQIEDDLQAAIKLSPEFAPPYGLMAFYLATQNEDLSEALSDSRRAIALEPGNSEYRIAEGQVLARMQNFTAARGALQFARECASTPQESLRVEMFASALDDMEKYANAANADVQQGSGSAATESPSREEPQTRDVAPADAGSSMDLDVMDATGTVTDATCANGLKLQLSTANGMLQLRNAPGGTVRIEATWAIPQGFTPCGLKGRRIAARYVADGGNAHSGILEVIQLLDSKP